MSSPVSRLSSRRAEQFSRQLVLPEVGPKGQERLASARVLVVGCGGLGSPVIQHLACAGVGRLTLMDDDVVEVSNLNRQTLHRAEDVGRLKAVRAAEWVSGLDAGCEAVGLTERFSTHNGRELVREHGLVLDCTDGAGIKYLVNDACVLERRTLVHGAVTAFEGQLLVLTDGRGPCLRCAFPEVPDPSSVRSCQEAGVLGAACGAVGSFMALEALKLICGFGRTGAGHYMSLDLLSSALSTLPLAADPGCPACGERPRVDARTDEDYEFACAVTR